MRQFTHDVVTSRVVFAPGALDRVVPEAELIGGRRVLLIGGRHEKAHLDRVADALGPRLAGRIADVVQHVPEPVAGSAARLAGDVDADLLVCVGGGSATGLAKAVARQLGTPILAVPTTYSGSEMSPFWGLTGAAGKATGRDPRVLPRTVVYDPLTTLSMPPELTATSGMNALAHAVEALYAPEVSPVVALVAEEAVRAFTRALPRAVAAPDDLEARSDALYGAFLAGVALGNAALGIHHKLCHVLGGAYNLPHSGVHSAVLPYATAYNRCAAPAAMSRIAAALGADDAATGLWDLGHGIGAPLRLTAVGFDPAAIDDVAAAVAAAPPANPHPVTVDGVRALLRAACAGSRPDPPSL